MTNSYDPSFPYDNRLIEDTRFDSNVVDKYFRIRTELRKICESHSIIQNIKLKCTSCRRPHQPVINFINIRTGKQTRTCIMCRQRKRAYNYRNDVEKTIEENLKEHFDHIKDGFCYCMDCGDEFDEDAPNKKQMFYRNDHKIDTRLYRFRSIKKMNSELPNYDVICFSCYSIRKVLYVDQ